ncbi:hypothetical protein GCM10022255_111300 [Dactylosporangium darangshiense]|uniref:Uncharacterized protein n=1 Tax=Dactylosporangium darangshiense TaxID=579108 RepID=A0ABP8DV68_9ACTN
MNQYPPGPWWPTDTGGFSSSNAAGAVRPGSQLDVASDEPVGRWRHRAHYARARADLSVYDVCKPADF